MKIVTTWQRGIGATGDEIRKKRHNKRRIFSYSLIILFSYSLICVFGGGFAAAAKLCVPGRYGQNMVFSSVDRSWVIGSGCTGTNAKNGPGDLVTTATYSGVGKPVGFCADVAVAGIAAWDPDGRTGCWCKMTYPTEGVWMYNDVDSASKCGSCGHYIQHYAFGIYVTASYPATTRVSW